MEIRGGVTKAGKVLELAMERDSGWYAGVRIGYSVLRYRRLMRSGELCSKAQMDKKQRVILEDVGG